MIETRMPTADPDRPRAADVFAVAHDTVYLDCAAMGPRLHAVVAAGHAALDASITPWLPTFEAWEAQIEALRSCVAETLFDGDSDGIALVPSAAYGLATAARNVALAAGDVVLALDGQFPSNLLPWQQRCTDTGARMLAVQRGDSQDWATAICAALQTTPRVRVVALPNAHWNDGAWVDLDRVAPQVHAAGAALVLDLSQSLGALPVALARWRPDFIVAVGHKWLLGPPGLAWLWASARWRSEGIAIAPHWSARDAGHDWTFPVEAAPAYRRGARRFDAGGVSDGLRLAMAQAAIEQIRAWQVPWLMQQLQQRTDAFDAALDAHGLQAWKTPGHAAHFTALQPPPGLLDAVADALRDHRIVCTRRRGVLRIAPHLHVDVDTMREVVAVAAAVVCAR